MFIAALASVLSTEFSVVSADDHCQNRSQQPIEISPAAGVIECFCETTKKRTPTLPTQRWVP